MITVYAAHIKDLTDNEINEILSSLSQIALDRLNKKRNEALRLASLNALSLIPEEMRPHLDYTESGKPFFKALDANISISHSESLCAVALSTSKEENVGIDVEDEEKFTPDFSPTRFFTENERASAENGTPHIEIWTKKEALFKYLNSDIPFISLDTTVANQKFTCTKKENSLITVCTDQNSEIEFIYK